MRLGNFAKLLNIGFSDRLSVIRNIPYKNSDGTTGIRREVHPIYRDIPCRISFSFWDMPESSSLERNPIFQQVKIFCGIDTKLKKGDEVTVERIGDNSEVIHTYGGTLGNPNIFETHQELLFFQGGEA